MAKTLMTERLKAKKRRRRQRIRELYTITEKLDMNMSKP